MSVPLRAGTGRNPCERGFGLFALSAFGEAVRKETGRQVDLVSSDHLDDDLAAVIEREGVILYDRA